MAYQPRSRVVPAHPSRLARAAAAIVRGGVRIPGLRRLLLMRGVALPGFWFATGCAYAWAWILFGRHSVRDGLHVFVELPRWSFGRGGTTIGAIYLTHDRTDDAVLEHEAVHREQWRHYGLAFPVLSAAAGAVAHTNRFEVDADLAKGGYR
jgi:hypothetical protein